MEFAQGPHRSGCKFYAPGELESFIEQALNVEASTLGLGMCVVFKNADDADLFEASRSQRRIDWSDIGTQLRFSAPVARERRNVDRYALHQELFDQLWQSLLDLGRTPEAGEFDRLAEVKKVSGGINRAVALVVSHHGEQLWQMARKARTEDLLVYLAMTQFQKHFRQREIPPRIKHDIRSFFGDVATAQAQARDLLFAAGDSGEIELACENIGSKCHATEEREFHASGYRVMNSAKPVASLPDQHLNLSAGLLCSPSMLSVSHARLVTVFRRGTDCRQGQRRLALQKHARAGTSAVRKPRRWRDG